MYIEKKQDIDGEIKNEEIIEDAFERIGLQNVAGYQLKSARRSLNILFQEWGNRGLHYWEVANNNITLVLIEPGVTPPGTPFVISDQGSTEGNLLVGETAEYKAVYVIDQEDVEVQEVDLLIEDIEKLLKE